MAKLAVYHVYTSCLEHAIATEATATATLRIYQSQMLQALQQLDDKWRSYFHDVGREVQSKIVAMETENHRRAAGQVQMIAEGPSLTQANAAAQATLQHQANIVAEWQAKCETCAG